MRFSSDQLQEATEALAQRLPSRALRTAVEQGEISDDLLSLYGITDQTIGTLLAEHGINTQVLVQEAIERILLTTREKSSDLFSIVDPYMRDARNPLLPEVRTLICRLRGY